MSRTIHFIRQLGSGGFGEVYLADVHRDDGFVQRLAVKILNADKAQHPDIVARQRDEARLLAQINTDHIVKVFDLTEIDGLPAVLMEYVDGVDTLALRQSCGAMPARTVVQLGMGVSAALHAASTTINPITGQPLTVIHRDIKPANLMISRHGGVKVLDFGIARADFAREGETGSIMYGTARYIAPEQWLRGEITPAVDIFALGVTLLELLLGKALPKAPLDWALYTAHWRSVMDSLTVSNEIRDLLTRMLDHDPTGRPDAATIHALMTQIEETTAGPTLQRYASRHIPPLLEKQGSRQSTVLPRDKTIGMPKTHGRRRKMAALVLGVAFIFIGMQFGDRPVQTTDIPAPTTETTIAAEEPRTAAPPLEIDPAPVPSPVPAPVPNTAPAPTVIPVPVVAPVPVTSAPIPAASHPVSFASVPLGAELIVDGVSMGTTPQRLQLTGGSHRIEMVLREHNTMQTIAIGVHSANAFSWRVDEDRWVNSRN